MTLIIETPDTYGKERDYIFGVILNEFLGLPWQRISSNRTDTRICLSGHDGEIILPDILLQTPVVKWLTEFSMPAHPLSVWNTAELSLPVCVIDPKLPVIFGSHPVRAVSINNSIRLPIDLFGSAFFMLSRYEEAVLSERDNHDRFPATASIAYKTRFLDRPIVDEYVEILWAAMKRVWPSLKRKRRQPQTMVSCDVDHPYVCGSGTVKGMIRRMGGELLMHRSPTKAMQSLANSWRVRRGDYSRDPYLNAIDWMMKVNERVGNRVAFYFIADHSHPTLDGCYDLDELVIRDLIRSVHARGHEIGLHASYNTYQDAAQTGRETDRLRQVLEEEGVQQDEIGGRQHYLRWETPTTARNWENVGLAYDSTLSFADRPGFRCGTCHEYPIYDVVEHRPLNLRERPLVVMECSVIADRHLGLGYGCEALETMLTLKRRCHQFGGDFTLLWHNSHFSHPKDREFYQELIA